MMVYADVVTFYNGKSEPEAFSRLWSELHAPGVASTGLEMRLQRATEGKDAANKCVPFRDINLYPTCISLTTYT